MAGFSTVVAFDVRVDPAPLSPLVRRLLVLVVPAWPCLVIIGSFVLRLVLGPPPGHSDLSKKD